MCGSKSLLFSPQLKDAANWKLFKEEYFPDECRDQFIYCGKKVIIEYQKHDDYEESMKWLLQFVEEYAQHGCKIGEHSKDSHTALTSILPVPSSTRRVHVVWSKDIIFDAANNLIDDANKQVTIEAYNYINFSPNSAISNTEHHHGFTLTFGQMQADMRDVAIYFRKTMIKISDSGLGDVVFGGEGLSTINLVKNQIQKVIKSSITTGMEYIDRQLVNIMDRMASAKAAEGVCPEFMDVHTHQHNARPLPNASLICAPTPESAKTRTGFNGQQYVLTFSDEFEIDGGTFFSGDLWYPNQVITRT
ncbi:hypothetical protein PILCRDRAFT_11286 [Piloderma croceum F 1598]|uniref:HAM1-like N-terminal domain-containing protein n=1 Tax=Piloderma croceum (strain F 1598) TaxID=765440 RepID=A0A0C3F0H4_PILCF|nr:hypothetical protein PILCRDRAFT_11286 [Piloderma croceum F 1598]